MQQERIIEMKRKMTVEDAIKRGYNKKKVVELIREESEDSFTRRHVNARLEKAQRTIVEENSKI